MESAQFALQAVSQLEDRALITGLERLVREDRALTARLLVQLGEVDARGLFRERAWPSMFAYAVSELHMSEAEAYLRIHAARLGRRFPLVVELLGKGVLHLSAIKLLGPHLTTANHRELLGRASCKSKREVELLVAEVAPRPDVKTVLAPVPRAQSVATVAACGTALPLEVPMPGRVAAPSAQVAAAPVTSPVATQAPEKGPLPVSEPAAAPVLRLTPLSPGRFKLQLTAGQGLHDKLVQLQELLRHRVPNGDLAVILEQAAELLIEKTVRERFAQTKRSRGRDSVVDAGSDGDNVQVQSAVTPDTGTREAGDAIARAEHEPSPADPARGSRSRYVPRAVVRAVYARDGGRCAFVSPDGRRCSERGLLELHHHDVPHARGGAPTVENLRLMCRAHNGLFAELDFGREFMRAKLDAARRRPREAELVPERAC